ncbi:hypothetical protein HYPSUDRAFT_209799 [Hypholoma sublateritium FD-334 SS-4]|uniref:CxC2-like cysteine cluster KDZ transposase-associated domain-containing protein n=1 Tax=Hypholoma sublateritium (strain FD-334 SS-4) TaxID=945553 RepID=A0A0D2NXC2_HYPSF|nr:hypothetical protein HYPSUDRAFT_209799 [Hypholoma sublateritium FD-334 SS-4]
MGKISTYDMYRSIERLTNNTGIDMPRPRYRPAMRCLNQWRHLKALKRAGRGHDSAGAAATANGELAILCPSCPHPGINLPSNWAEAPGDKQFLYMYLICMDANFRLKNRLISNLSVDPGLWNGLAYMALRSPYEAYVLSQADEKDISTCVGFQALAKATTQSTRGLRYTGVGAAMCGRSEMVLPNSVANLQKGERYANMDYVFASAIKSTKLLLVAISYDISLPNPFKTVELTMTEDEVQERLGKDEAAVLKATGRTPLHQTSASSFLAMGLDLEEDKRRLKVFAAEQENIPKNLRTSALRDQRKILKEKMQNWETVRSVYMPGVLQIQTNLGLNSTALWNSDPNPEDVQLWLPSEISAAQRRAACVEGLPEMELQLRTAQCNSSLQGLRQTLRVKTRMIYFKNKNIRGQRGGTRSRSIIDRVHKRAISFVHKYRAARQAKLVLEGPGSWEQIYRELRNEDVRGFASGKPKKVPLRRGIWEDGHAPPTPETANIFNETSESESDPDLDAQEAVPAGPARKKRKLGTGETRKQLSWIWRTLPLLTGADEDDDILRAEWARSRARVRRASEEVMLVREEMRLNDVLESLEAEDYALDGIVDEADDGDDDDGNDDDWDVDNEGSQAGAA